MKQTVYCEGCQKIIRKAGSFTAELTRPVIVLGIKLSDNETVKIHLCRDCTAKAGYKVKDLK